MVKEKINNKNMKTVFVTIKEFTENGGKLDEKRPVFNNQYNQVGYINQEGGIDYLFHITRYAQEEMEIPLEKLFVQINVKPIYV